MKPENPMRKLDPQKLAYYEKENYIAYYQKDWLKLLRVSVGMVKEAFGFTWWQAFQGAYLVARAQIAFAPFPSNNVALAIAYMRRFYQLVRDVHQETFDVDRAAKYEVHWWGVHRKLFGKRQNEELVEALLNLYAVAYGGELANLRPAAYYRAMGMLYSDLWVNAGRPSESLMLAKEEEALYKSYVELKQVLQN